MMRKRVAWASAQETAHMESTEPDAGETQRTEYIETNPGETEHTENTETDLKETKRIENTIEEISGESRVVSSGASIKKRYREDGSEIIETESESEQKQESESETEPVRETRSETETEAVTVVEIPVNEEAGKTNDLSGYLKYLPVVSGVILVLVILAVVFKKKDKRNDEKPEPDGFVGGEKDVFVYFSNAQERIAVSVADNGRRVMLGRKAGAVLAEDPKPADVCMTLWYDQGRYWIKKSGKENTLKFNGRQLQKGEVRALYSGAVLEFDGMRYQFTEEQK